MCVPKIPPHLGNIKRHPEETKQQIYINFPWSVKTDSRYFVVFETVGHSIHDHKWRWCLGASTREKEQRLTMTILPPNRNRSEE